MTTLHETSDGLWLMPKVRRKSSFNHACASRRKKAKQLDDVRREHLELAREMAGDALRVLAVAEKSHATLKDAEHDMTLLARRNDRSAQA